LRWNALRQIASRKNMSTFIGRFWRLKDKAQKDKVDAALCEEPSAIYYLQVVWRA
jgi:hypothetical protein